MSFNDWLQVGRETVEFLNDGSFDHLQGFVESKQELKLVYEDEKLDEINTGTQSGMGISATRNRNTNFFSFSDRDACLSEQSNMRSLLDVESGTSIQYSEPETLEMPVESPVDNELEESKIDRLRSANRVARDSDDRIDQVRVDYSEKTRRIGVIDSEGWIRIEPQQYTQFKVMVVATENGKREKGYGRAAGYQGETLFDDESPEDLATRAAEQALTSIEAEPVDPGPRTVVIAPGFGGTIFHEACGHGFEADHIFEDVSKYTGRMGEKVASELVTFVDEGARENLYGAFRIDDEGQKARRNVLIKDGVMQGVMSDVKYANLLDIEPTGNGRRQSFHHPVLPRMTNTYIEAGDADPESILEDTDEGIYASHIGGGQVDPASGDFIFSLTEGYRIEDGECKEPIRDAALVGNGPEVLNRIDAVGHDLEMKPGVCGKGQWVPVTVGQPTLRVRDLRVGGEGT